MNGRFVRTLAGIPAAAPWAALSAEATSEEYWRQVKAQFRFHPGIIPMNAADLCPVRA